MRSYADSVELPAACSLDTHNCDAHHGERCGDSLGWVQLNKAQVVAILTPHLKRLAPLYFVARIFVYLSHTLMHPKRHESAGRGWYRLRRRAPGAEPVERRPRRDRIPSWCDGGGLSTRCEARSQSASKLPDHAIPC